MSALSPVTITALAEVIAGEARSKEGASLGGKVRSAREIQRFMMEFDVDFSNPWSKVKDLRKCLLELPKDTLLKVLKGAFDTNSFEKRHVNMESVAYINRYLNKDGFKVEIINGVGEVKVLEPEQSIQATSVHQSHRSSYSEGFWENAFMIVVIPFALIWLAIKFVFEFLFKTICEIITRAWKFLIIVAALAIVITILNLAHPFLPPELMNQLLESLHL